MKHQNNSISILLLLVFCLQAACVLAQEVEDEREFDYWEKSEKGPRRWGELKEEWAACKNGEMQSPIDLSSRRVSTFGRSSYLRRFYKPSNATVKNRGHDISVQWTVGEAGSARINGTEFFLEQGHWHSPSEHSINGRRYAMELHMVHLLPDHKGKNKAAVIAVLYRIGKPDRFLSLLMKNISSMNDEKGERHMGVIDPREMKLGSRSYYRYMGSLTTPPCTEGVVWIISRRVRTVSREQVKLLREVVHDYAEKNARPLQPQNEREIHLHVP